MATRWDKELTKLAKKLYSRGWNYYQVVCLYLTAIFIPTAFILNALFGIKTTIIASIVVFFVDFLCVVFTIFFGRNQKLLRLEKKKRMLDSEIKALDSMEHFAFEEFIAKLYKDQGYRTIVTQKTRDYGADVIANKGIESICIQVKHYSKAVSLDAVQQAMAAQKKYLCTSAAVVTNSHFTKPAKDLAAACQVDLIDRNRLMDMIILVRNQNVLEMNSIRSPIKNASNKKQI